MKQDSNLDCSEAYGKASRAVIEPTKLWSTPSALARSISQVTQLLELLDHFR
jgi:hypothetical protein